MARSSFSIWIAFAIFSTSLLSTTTAQHVVLLTDDTFERATHASTGTSPKSWFVKFYAPWCGFSRKLVPTWEELASTVEQQDIVIAAVDVTASPMTAKRFDILSYPTLVYFVDGKMFFYNGELSLQGLQDFLQNYSEATLAREVPPDNHSWSSVQWDRFYIALSKNKYMQLLFFGVIAFNSVLVVVIIFNLVAWNKNKVKAD